MSIKNKAEKNPLVKDAIAAYENLIKDMDTQTQSQIEAQAEHLSASDLAAGAESVKGRYVVVDGQVQGEETTMVDQNMAIPNMVAENLKTDTKGYVLNDGIVLVDISGEAGEMLKGGDWVRGYGAVLVVRIADVFEFPIAGPDLKKEFGSGMDAESKVIFFFSKGVKKISEAEAVHDRAHAATDPGGAEPSVAPGAGGEANPCAGTSAPPAAGGNPCNPCTGGGTPPTAPPTAPPATPPADPPADPPATPPAAPPSGG